jgi:excisionase family DNA binding protein
MNKKSYRVDEAAEELGVSRRTVERAIATGEIHAYKVRDTRRIDADEVDRIKKKETEHREF